MRKRILSLFTIVCMLVAMLPALPAIAYNMGKVGEFQTISAGWDHVAAIKTDGSLWTWGNNEYGQLGDGTTENKSTPVKIMEDVVGVSAGSLHTAAIKEDGSLWTWGFNGMGELGDGTAEDKYEPVKVMDDVAAVSVSHQNIKVIKKDGSLWDLKNVPEKIMDNVLAVSAGIAYSAAIKEDGSLWTWGNNEHGQLGDGTTENRSTPVKIMENVTAVSTGEFNTAAITTDGSLWIWGDGQFRQPDNSATEDYCTPTKIMSDVVSVSMCRRKTVVKVDNSLWTLEYNLNGEFGNDTMANRVNSVKIMDNVVDVSEGNDYTAAITTDGSLWTWGINNYGQIGDGTTEYKYSPVKVMDNVKLPRGASTAIAETTPTPEIAPEPAPQNTVTTSFGATVSDWAAPEIELAYENNLIPEVMVDFDLTQKVNRGEFAAIALQLYDVLANTETTLPASCPFTDIAGDVNEIAIKKASSLDITNGTSATTFEPVSFITREQLATMLCRVIKKYGFEGWTLATDSDYYMNTDGAVLFADDADISDWAKPSVYYMSLHGIIKGIDETHFAPKNTTTQQEASGYASATREQAIILAQRIFTKSDMLGNLN